MGITAVVLAAVGVGVIFWAGMTADGANSGRNEDERAAIDAFTLTYQDIADRFIGTPVPAEVLGGALGGMFDVLGDPYSGYMSPTEYDSALDSALGEFEGIGAEMKVADEAGEPCEVIGADCRLEVVEALVDAPAEGAGLLAGDLVTGVDGESLAGATIDDAVLLVRGPRGSDVELSVERDDQELEIIITRDKVISDDVHSATLANGEVGYIAIANFSGAADEDFEMDLQAHLDAGLDKLIVDVRDDPGGFVDATVAISSQFIADGAVFWEETADGRQVSVDVSGDGLATDPALEVVLLVDGGSASASEILGGALQDAGRARLVGQQTFGKGTVQEWSELPGQSGGYRLSVAKWLTRDKTWIDGTGLTPDVIVELGERRYRPGVADADPATDIQLQTALALLLDEPLPTPSPSPGPSPKASASDEPEPSTSG
jgi:carboxyl-terminal processing protease